jgi:hypothetical protein
MAAAGRMMKLHKCGGLLRLLPLQQPLPLAAHRNVISELSRSFISPVITNGAAARRWH